MKYLLKNKSTGQETLCDKVTLDGFDYYVNNEKLKDGDVFYNSFEDNQPKIQIRKGDWGTAFNQRKIIATNNRKLHIAQVIDEVENLAYQYYTSSEHYQVIDAVHWTKGFNKAKETYKWTDEDILDFGEWCENLQMHNKDIRRSNPNITRAELLDIWKEQKYKVIRYE